MRNVQQLLKDGGVPGLSMALIRDGEVAGITTAGIRNTSRDAPVDARTIFDAASLSKPVFAYAVLQLVDAGALSLDTRLATYVPDYVSDDPRAGGITVRNVLSHTTGLPNWRNNDHLLKTYFPPGERFSYSGEGFVWLQRVVETISGESVGALTQRLVFDPLMMRNSSYAWRQAFDANYADPHDAALTPATKVKRAAANTAYSLQTTGTDYARFMQAALSGARLEPERRASGFTRRRPLSGTALNACLPVFPKPISTSTGVSAGALNPTVRRSSTGVITRDLRPLQSALWRAAPRLLCSRMETTECRSCPN